MRLLSLFLVVVILKPSNCIIGRRDNNSKKFIKPCFDGEEIENTCSEPSDSCDGKLGTEFKLVRLDGFKTGHVQLMEVGDDKKKVKLITRAMTPLIFEIPEFLTHEECDHIISLAKESGLQTSTSGFFNYEADLDAVLAIADRNSTLPPEKSFAGKFDAWDENSDGFVDAQEVKTFAEKYKQLYLEEDELHDMFERVQINNQLKNGRLTMQSFNKLNMKTILRYMDFLKNNSPRHRFRFSQQAWLPQDKTADPVLRRLHEKLILQNTVKIIKLTKLPKKIVQGGEPMQVVRYEKFGHFHAHMDSTIKDPDVPCCHQNYLRASDCRVCRFITILYFLNDVEEGGETAFLMADNTTITPEEIEKTEEINLSINCRSANLILPPKKGTAIMWYNNFIDPESGLLGPVDRHTLHGGCDVIRGEKWIANNWLTPLPSTQETSRACMTRDSIELNISVHLVYQLISS